MKNPELKKIIVIFGGSLIQDEHEKWCTTRFNEGDNFGALGDYLRVAAAAYMYKNNNNLSFLACGGKGQLKTIYSAPFISEIVKQELIDLGVPKNKIETEKKSNTTYEQLVELVKYVKAKNIKNTEIISNEHHLARIRYMIQYGPKLESLRKLDSLKLISAEKICLKYNPKRWENEIEKAYASEAMKQRIKIEQEGIDDLKNGRYKFL